MVVDYSAHMQDFWRGGSFAFAQFATYYANYFIVRLEFLLPLAFLISITFVLGRMNRHREITAFQAAGIRSIVILKPMIHIAFAISVFLLFSSEYLYPQAREAIRNEKHLMQSEPNRHPISALQLPNGSKAIYHKKNENNVFENLFWIHAKKRIYAIGRFDSQGIAHNVDVITLDKQTQTWSKEESFEKLEMPVLLHLIEKGRDLNQIDLAHHRLSTLLKEGVSTHLLQKLVMPFLSLLLLFCLSPYLMAFSYKEKILPIFAISLFAFIIFFSIMSGCLILGAGEIGSAWILMGVPFGTLFLFALFNWIKIDRTQIGSMLNRNLLHRIRAIGRPRLKEMIGK